jgi:restriction system protein
VARSAPEATGQRVVRPGIVVPRHLELMTPTLEALRQLGGSATIAELVDKVIDIVKPSPEILEHPHGDGRNTELEYQLAWARTYLKKAGLLTNSAHGVWALTPKGSDATVVDVPAVVKLIRADRQPRKRRGKRPTPVQGTAGPVSAAAPDDSWRDRLLAALLAMSPAAFERLAQRLLREAGFIEVEVTGRSGDGGIDGHGIIRVAGLISFPVLFQCKRYSGNAGPSAVRDFRGAMMAVRTKASLSRREASLGRRAQKLLATVRHRSISSTVICSRTNSRNYSSA